MEAAEEVFGHALAEGAELVEIGEHIVGHAAHDPVHDEPEAFAAVEARDQLPVLRGNGKALRGRIDIQPGQIAQTCISADSNTSRLTEQ